MTCVDTSVGIGSAVWSHDRDFDRMERLGLVRSFRPLEDERE